MEPEGNSATTPGDRLRDGMAVPDYQSLMRPVLAQHKGAGEIRRSRLRDALAAELGLSQEDREERLPSGTQATFDNRVNWAVVYLNRAGLFAHARAGSQRDHDSRRRGPRGQSGAN
jgi:restriction system protein